jgi:large-conductance mechanosensitive channel
MRLSLPLVPVIGSNIVNPLKLSILETKMDKLSRVVLMLALENIVIAYGDFMVQIYDF